MSSLQATAAMDSALTVIIGPSQHGKSTLIEILLDGSDSVAIGNGSGISCTTELKLYQNTKIGRLLDTVGFDDSDQLLSNQAIAEQLASFWSTMMPRRSPSSWSTVWPTRCCP